MNENVANVLSLLGLGIQIVGVCAVALLFLLLRRAVGRLYFHHWMQAWLAMVAALVALQTSFLLPETVRWPLQAAYFLGEYLFVAFLHMGFVCYPKRTEGPALSRWLVAALLLWSLLLALPGDHFAERFALHAPVFAGALLWAAWHLRRLPLTGEGHWAKAFAILSVSILSLNFFVNALASADWLTAQSLFGVGYSAYQSIIDLFLEVALAFSLVALAAVDLRATAVRARAALEGERDRMAMLAHRDALTGCFNRLALEGLRERLEGRSGVVAVVDMNGLKVLNDRWGHERGDLAICYVAHALTALLREQDHVFRVGGDEFVLVAFGIDGATLTQRLGSAQQVLQGTYVPGTQGLRLSMAFGVAEFTGAADFESAKSDADGRMYVHKRGMGAARGTSDGAAPAADGMGQ